MTIYKIRMVCETEVGDNKGWHYVHLSQETTVDENIQCSEHPTATVKDFVIESEEIG